MPQGECSDSHGDVFITDAFGSNIQEFAHGGTTPIANLSDVGEEASGCAVDSVTGNLAVTNYYPGNVAIYKNAEGTPTFTRTRRSATITTARTIILETFSLMVTPSAS